MAKDMTVLILKKETSTQLYAQDDDWKEKVIARAGFPNKTIWNGFTDQKNRRRRLAVFGDKHEAKH